MIIGPERVVPPTIRRRLRVTGVVQGVGFRPYVYGLARANDLAGLVGNDSQGVFIEVEGPLAAVKQFRHQLWKRVPPLAFIESVTSRPLAPAGDQTFRIVPSRVAGAANTLISPDISICGACRAELLDPDNRRYQYPFINCTHCGPRFSIIKDLPYDRPLTTMQPFSMCPACQAEYDDPANRRFHAQPNACAECGPQIWLEMAHVPTPAAARLAALQIGQHADSTRKSPGH